MSVVLELPPRVCLGPVAQRKEQGLRGKGGEGDLCFPQGLHPTPCSSTKVHEVNGMQSGVVTSASCHSTSLGSQLHLAGEKRQSISLVSRGQASPGAASTPGDTGSCVQILPPGGKMGIHQEPCCLLMVPASRLGMCQCDPPMAILK